MRARSAHVVAEPTLNPGPPTFVDLANAHVRAHGGEWHVVDRRKTPGPWRAWLAYFAHLDEQTYPPGRKAAFYRKLEQITVPALWPLDFDLSAPPSPQTRGLDDDWDLLPLGRRRDLADMQRSAVYATRVPEPPKPTPTPAQRFADTVADWAANPPVLSDEMRARMGVAPKPPPVQAKAEDQDEAWLENDLDEK